MTSYEFLRDLSERLMQVPTIHGIDQGDSDKLNAIAEELETAPDREEMP